MQTKSRVHVVSINDRQSISKNKILWLAENEVGPGLLQYSVQRTLVMEECKVAQPIPLGMF